MAGLAALVWPAVPQRVPQHRAKLAKPQWSGPELNRRHMDFQSVALAHQMPGSLIFPAKTRTTAAENPA